jgi:hypothetical protein
VKKAETKSGILKATVKKRKSSTPTSSDVITTHGTSTVTGRRGKEPTPRNIFNNLLGLGILTTQ